MLFKPNTYVSVFNFPSEIASSYASVAAITNSWCANLEPRLRAKNGTRSSSSVAVRFFEISSSSSSKEDDNGEEEEEEEEHAVLFAPLLSFLFLCLLLCLPFNITFIASRVVIIRVVVFVLLLLVVADDDATKVATLLVVVDIVVVVVVVVSFG